MSRPFAEQFAQAWARPTPAGLVALLQPDARLLQPHQPPIQGREAALEEFRRLLAWLPALHGEVTRWSQSGDTVFIEWRMRLPLGRRTITIPAVDRFLLRDGLGAERVVYFDPMRLVAAVLSHPPLWPGYLKYRFAI
ncbi:nuclear transport factor 2 family protein [Solimonas fluminis]|uniref:nuclear transport factor 2 family protein n=1 Tax=Solimonas fluminis TaxID=2086571 RepID=UPI0013FDE3B6|nr:nuclear transport factor 2 family protein [Solimonas fluminis]